MFLDSRTEETGFSFSEAVPAPPDRRRQDRIVTILRVGVLDLEGRRELCLIRNISAGGLMAHVYSQVRIGQRVMIELKTNQQIEGHVAWVRDANAGIAFDRPVDVAELLAAPAATAQGWRARTPRVEVDRLASLRSGASTFWVQASDVSQGGVKIVTDQVLKVGSEVVLTLDGFRALAGTVRWQNGRTAGIAFNDLIPFGELIAWLKRDDVV